MRWTKRLVKRHPEKTFEELMRLIPTDDRIPELLPSALHATINARAEHPQQIRADLQRFKQQRRYGQLHPVEPPWPEDEVAFVDGRIVVWGADL